MMRRSTARSSRRLWCRCGRQSKCLVAETIAAKITIQPTVLCKRDLGVCGSGSAARAAAEVAAAIALRTQS